MLWSLTLPSGMTSSGATLRNIPLQREISRVASVGSSWHVAGPLDVMAKLLLARKALTCFDLVAGEILIIFLSMNPGLAVPLLRGSREVAVWIPNTTQGGTVVALELVSSRCLRLSLVCDHGQTSLSH